MDGYPPPEMREAMGFSVVVAPEHPIIVLAGLAVRYHITVKQASNLVGLMGLYVATMVLRTREPLLTAGVFTRKPFRLKDLATRHVLDNHVINGVFDRVSIPGVSFALEHVGALLALLLLLVAPVCRLCHGRRTGGHWEL